jgi:signal transduction histidine kinase
MLLVGGVSPDPRVEQTHTMPIEARMVLDLATAQELDTGMAAVVASLRTTYAAARVEWWALGEEGELELVASDGAGGGQERRFPLGLAGEVVVIGRCDPRLTPALAAVVPVLRRRCAEERLASAATRLARNNQALEEFAALVAHELKTPLHAALLADDGSTEVARALDLVDSLLEAAHEQRESPVASAAICLEQAIQDLGAVELEVTAGATTDLPLPPASLRVILRNLLRNAVAAGARRVHVMEVRSAGASQLVVVDDGVGPDAVGAYTAGSGLGLNLCRRIASRYGGALELAPRATGGTRATLQFGEQW